MKLVHRLASGFGPKSLNQPTRHFRNSKREAALTWSTALLLINFPSKSPSCRRRRRACALDQSRDKSRPIEPRDFPSGKLPQKCALCFYWIIRHTVMASFSTSFSTRNSPTGRGGVKCLPIQIFETNRVKYGKGFKNAMSISRQLWRALKKKSPSSQLLQFDFYRLRERRVGWHARRAYL